MEAHIRAEQTESFPQDGEIQNGDTGNHQDIPPTRGVGHLNRFQRRLLHIPIQEQSRKYLRFHVQGQTYQFKALPYTQGYKNPPIPRRLVGESQIPPGLSPAYSRSSENMPKIRLAGEFGQVGTGTKADLRFCRLPVRPQGRSGLTDSRPVAEPSGQNTGNTVTTDLFGPAVHVSDRFTNSHRKTNSPRPAAHETHTVASQKQLENTRVIRKVILIPRSLHSHLQWWLQEDNILTGQPLHPIKHAVQIFTDASKEGWGAHLNEHTARGAWSLPESKLHINYLEIKAVFLALKEFQDLCTDKIVLVATDNATVVSYINKEGGMRSGPLCALLWRILTWCTRKQVTLKARHIPGWLNVVADKLSRLFKQSGLSFKRCSRQYAAGGTDLK